jgi:hypothetical protein
LLQGCELGFELRLGSQRLIPATFELRCNQRRFAGSTASYWRRACVTS